MMDLDLKKKIANTLSQYEHKCDQLQAQVVTLKNVINQLIMNPGINYEKDEHFSQLQAQVNAEFDAAAIEKKANRLVHVIDKLEKKKAQKNRAISQLIQQSTDSASRLALKSEDKRAISKLQKMLSVEVDHYLVMEQFSATLALCVSSVLHELDKARRSPPNIYSAPEVSSKVNESLQQLLNHLSIPQDLDTKREDIKDQLEQHLAGDNLNKVIDGLTELVIDAFNVEQHRFKGFLQQVTYQLHNFDVFLNQLSTTHNTSSEECQELEDAIQGDIEQIKNHLDGSKSVHDLSMNVSQHLAVLGGRIKEYRANQLLREQEYQKQVLQLKSKLNESEQNAEKIKTLLTSQKYRINHDSLTGLPNRESYNEYITEVMQDWHKTGQPVSLAVGDIDHFKRINDTFGHLAGDKVLKKVAEIFKSLVRKTDCVARFGGEEFVLILPGTTSQSTFTIIEQLRKAVEECHFVYHESKVVVTVSFGATTIVEGDSIESLFMRADNALYKAKNSGRNRCVLL